MNWPTSQDYNQAIQNPARNLSDPDLKCGEVIVNSLGLPVPHSGSFADVYQCKGGDGRMWALKCFTRQVAGLEERYFKIDEYLAMVNLPFTVGFKYLPEGIRIRRQWYPLLKMEWVEGCTLNEFVRQNAERPQYLHALMQIWARLTAKLRNDGIAHADLQHGNVLLVPGSTPSKLGVKLIDYDGMWVPTLAESHSGELGHPDYQHPQRLKDKLFNADVDRFPHLVIACALRATIVGGKALWEKYDSGDNLLFRERDLCDPSGAPIFKALWNLNDSVLRVLAGHLALSSRQPLRDTPWLDEILFHGGGPRLSASQLIQVADMLGTEVPVADKPSSMPAMMARFGEFRLVEDDDDRKLAARRAPADGGRNPDRLDAPNYSAETGTATVEEIGQQWVNVADTAKPVGAIRPHRAAKGARAVNAKVWLWATVSVAAMLFLVIAMWAAGVFQAAPTGVLIIENVPANAVVTVDDESVTFLRSGEQVTVEALNRGNHRIKVVSNGVELLSRDVTVKVDAEPTRVRAKNLNPKKAKSNDKPKR